jgi:hypothetical protein
MYQLAIELVTVSRWLAPLLARASEVLKVAAEVL